MKSGYLVTGIRFRKLIRLILRNRVSLLPRYAWRFLFLLQNALWSSFFTRRDKIIWGEYIDQYPVPKDPIFIIGHWRTGSTYLHRLMNLDDRLSAPTLYQTSLPEAFVTARAYYAPIMAKMIGEYRPFDNMKVGIDEPQEDEFAIFRSSTYSPLELIMFPKHGQYFLADPDCQFIPGGEKGKQWEQAMLGFYRKVAWYSKKRLLLKNPFHSMRMDYLVKLFPDARFIHIYRNPLEVIPSTIKMWSVVGKQNCMNQRFRVPDIEAVSSFYSLMIKEIERSLAKLPEGQYTLVKYEELVADPIRVIKKAYTEIGLDFHEELEQKIRETVEANKNYEKNFFELQPPEKQVILDQLAWMMDAYGYRSPVS